VTTSLDYAADDMYDATGFRRDRYSAGGLTRPLFGRGAPAIEDTEDGYVIDVELPGIVPEDVFVDLRGRWLRVSTEELVGGRRSSADSTRRVTTRVEFEVPLPYDSDLDAIEADMADGLLTLWIPRLWEDRPVRRREVQVQRASAD